MSVDLVRLSREVSDAFEALAGGSFIVGKMAFYPLQTSVPSHLLCDGREVAKVSFPELYAFLGDSQGTSVDPDNFVLPNFIGADAFTPPSTSDTETTDGGTTNTGLGGDVDSGGRPKNYREPPDGGI